MTFRPAVEADIPLIIDLAQRIWRASYPGIISAEQIAFMLNSMYSEKEIRHQLSAGVAWEIAEIGGAAIGYLSFRRDDERGLKINKLYIVPERQRQGHGQEMLSHICERARALGVRAALLQVNKQNSRAIGAYRKAGFTIVEEAVFDIGGGFVMDDYIMAKSVREEADSAAGGGGFEAGQRKH